MLNRVQNPAAQAVHSTRLLPIYYSVHSDVIHRAHRSCQIFLKGTSSKPEDFPAKLIEL